MSYEEQRAILIQYLQVMIARCDWHGVADVAMDLREMEAERRANTLESIIHPDQLAELKGKL